MSCWSFKIEKQNSNNNIIHNDEECRSDGRSVCSNPQEATEKEESGSHDEVAEEIIKGERRLGAEAVGGQLGLELDQRGGIKVDVIRREIRCRLVGLLKERLLFGPRRGLRRSVLLHHLQTKIPKALSDQKGPALQKSYHRCSFCGKSTEFIVEKIQRCFCLQRAGIGQNENET